MVSLSKAVGHLAQLAQPLNGSLLATPASEGAPAQAAQPAQAQARQPSLPSLPPATSAQPTQPAQPCGAAQAARQPSPAEPDRHSPLSQLIWASPAKSSLWKAQSFFLRHEVAVARANEGCARFPPAASATHPNRIAGPAS